MFCAVASGWFLTGEFYWYPGVGHARRGLRGGCILGLERDIWNHAVFVFFISLCWGPLSIGLFYLPSLSNVAVRGVPQLPVTIGASRL